jgi:hypothetical protein
VTRVAVVTVVAGRHDHLGRQQTALARCRPGADDVVVVAMGDPGIEDVVADSPLRGSTALIELPTLAEGLPLAAARNAGVEAALARGAEVVVLLDVDCLPVPRLLGRYAGAADGPAADDVLCGPVAYLPPLEPGEVYESRHLLLARPHPARPDPPDGELRRGGDHRLFWSLSFAVTPQVWRRVGGFDEAYVGYGAEDTDFGQRAAREGVGLTWVGGATAHHQWHPVSDPPVEHLRDIVRNANLFRARWGWTPMEGWLDAFARHGLAEEDESGWRVRPQAARRARGATSVGEPTSAARSRARPPDEGA